MRNRLKLALSAILSVSFAASSAHTGHPFNGVRPSMTRNGLQSALRSLPAPPSRQKPMLTPAAESQNLPMMGGYVVYSGEWTQSTDYGVYLLPAHNNGFSKLFSTEPDGDVMCATMADGKYLVCEYADFSNMVPGLFYTYFIAYDIETGKELYRASQNDDRYAPFSMAFDSTSGTLYGVCLSEDYSGLELVTLKTGNRYIEKSTIGTFGADGCRALAVNSHGEMYAIDNSSKLYKVDKSTGSCTLVGDTGVDNQYFVGATFDLKTDRLYWTVSSDTTGALYEVNTTTGSGTLLKVFPAQEEVLGLFIYPSLYEEKAPGMATDLKAEFSNGSLTGNFSFTMPAKCYDGSELSGNCHYTIMANGSAKASGESSPGAKVNETITLDQAGEYEFEITISNTAGDGPSAKLTTFAGYGIPASTDAKFTYKASESHATVTWNAVSTTADGGYIDPAAVRYDVVRYPDAVKVCTDLNATTFSETLPAETGIKEVYYGVTAISNGLRSAESFTKAMTTGCAIPPYANDFNSGLGGFAVIDANNDGRTWEADRGLVQIPYGRFCDMDDWLISVPLKLEGGKAYRITFDAFALNGISETLEVRLGQEVNADSFTTLLLEPTEITLPEETPEHIECYASPTQTGIYYVGIHGISPVDRFYLSVDNFKIEAGTTSVIPGAVTGFEGKVNTDDNSVALTLKAPSTDMAGQPLSALTKITLSRNGNVVEIFDNPSPGATLSYLDKPGKAGLYSYTATAYNENGAGATVSIQVYAGIDYPLAPESVSLTETDNPGEVTASWNSVTTDIAGNTISQAKVKYNLYAITPTGLSLISRNITGTQHTFQAVDAGKQAFVQCAVYAVTERGEGEGTPSEMIAAGTPYSGMHESFPGGKLIDYIWSINQDGGGYWKLYNDAIGVPSQDGDNGFIGLLGGEIGNAGEIMSGKIDLSALENPQLTFYTYNMGGSSSNMINLFIKTGNSDFEQIKSITPSMLTDKQEWGKCIVSLADYKGQVIQLRFMVVVMSAAYTFIDNITVGEQPEHDLEAVSLKAPANVTTGEEYSVDMTVKNLGAKTADNWTAILYADSRIVAEVTGEAVSPLDNHTVSFKIKMHPLTEEASTLQAEILYDNDTNTGNNLTEEHIVTPREPALPFVSDLKVSEVTESSITLEWSNPAESGLDSAPARAAKEVTEDFESADSFSQNFGDWIFIDEDNAPAGSFPGVSIPGVTPGVTPLSFFIYDDSDGSAGNAAMAHSGHKCLASLVRQDDGQASDWVISPELSGEAQTIRFFAKSCDGMFKEKIEVLYSSGSCDIESFETVRAAENVPAEWTEYQVQLPAGAKRFAIHSCAKGAYMLMIDDVTYQPGGAMPVLSAFNVWRNGECITPQGVTSPGFTDENPGTEENEYVVTAIFDKGESKGSNKVRATLKGGAVSSAAATTFRVFSRKSVLSIRGTEGSESRIYALDGRIINVCSGDTDLNVEPGIYIIVNRGNTVKHAVK